MSNNRETEPTAAREFVSYWTGRGYEKGQTQPFWIGLLRVLGVECPDQGFIEFEDKANIDAAHGFIDGYIPATHVMIEQKSLGKDLRAAIRQSDGSLLSPYQQAKRYIVDLPLSRHPRWVVTCNFSEFLIYDMEKPNAEPESLRLENLPEELYRLKFLTDTGSETIRREEEISKKAGELVGQIYDALLKQYVLPTPAGGKHGGNGGWEARRDSNQTLRVSVPPKDSVLSAAGPRQLASLNELCVRLVFLLYAEDADVFQTRLQFHDYLKQFPASKARRALIDLFKVLDTPPEKRDPYLEADLAAFPYVNGGLFRGEIEIPQFNDEILDLVLRKGSEEFDWSGISPVIFGAVFESTLNPETRRRGGMHYTSVANIHKVIDPLFLDGLRAELAAIEENAECRMQNAQCRSAEPLSIVHCALSIKQRAALRSFIDHLASLTFLDPACGSGNFLTETYICLRRLENEALALLLGGQTMLDLEGDTIKVSISQFHGIEINDFAVKVAQTALWIAEHQMLRETASLLHRNLDFLPLRDYAGIVEGNALRIDWQSIPNAECTMQNAECGANQNSAFCIQHSAFSFIIGNPPFVGGKMMDAPQKEDMVSIFGGKWKNLGNMDYVCCWYKKAFDYMVENPATRAALVSTNSITQGQAVAGLFGPLMRNGLEIDFAHRTFRWDSESNAKAHVHCVIVGFSCEENSRAKSAKTAKKEMDESSRTSRTSREGKKLFDGERVSYVPHINGYLLPAADLFIQNRGSSRVHRFGKMSKGSQPTDGGNLILSPAERSDLLSENQALEPCTPQYISAEDYIKRNPRFCLWLVGIAPNLYRSSPEVMRRLAAVAEFRRKSPTESVRRAADTPMLFTQIRQPKTDYLVVPEVSSERRRYIPIGFIPRDVIVSNMLYVIPDASLFLFGILISNVHMAWMRVVAGRLESRYRYTPAVYNNFPWPENSAPSAPLRLCVEKIASTAQAILDARAAHPDCSLKVLYDELTMPPDLRRAHQENDRAVMAAYGFSTKMTESECVAALFERYRALTTSQLTNSPTIIPCSSSIHWMR